MSAVSDLKQAALDLAEAAGAIFDSLDAHGTDAVWEDTACLLALVRMRKSHDALADFFATQAASRMAALGISPEQLARQDMERSR